MIYSKILLATLVFLLFSCQTSIKQEGKFVFQRTEFCVFNNEIIRLPYKDYALCMGSKYFTVLNNSLYKISIYDDCLNHYKQNDYIYFGIKKNSSELFECVIDTSLILKTSCQVGDTFFIDRHRNSYYSLIKKFYSEKFAKQIYIFAYQNDYQLPKTGIICDKSCNIMGLFNIYNTNEVSDTMGYIFYPELGMRYFSKKIKNSSRINENYSILENIKEIKKCND